MPIVVINPIPGQEEENAEFLENFGVAIWLKNDSSPEEVFNSIFGNDDKLLFMKAKATELAKQFSTRDICNILLS